MTGELIRKALIDTAMEYYAAIKGNSKEVAAGEKDDGSMYCWEIAPGGGGRGKNNLLYTFFFALKKLEGDIKK